MEDLGKFPLLHPSTLKFVFPERYLLSFFSFAAAVAGIGRIFRAFYFYSTRTSSHSLRKRVTFLIRQWLPCIVLHTLIRGKLGERIGRARKRECKFFNSINHSQRVLLPLFKSGEYECVCVYIVHSRVRASHTYVSSNNQLLLLLYRCGARLDGPAMCYRLISLKLKKKTATLPRLCFRNGLSGGFVGRTN